ncbi:hypothetical protein M3Y97_00740400 [Aphelenchoides bicaudatus]|nr:hypothetical protein M3Y97_00740400 [Aphelenchoides bicaudatus]
MMELRLVVFMSALLFASGGRITYQTEREAEDAIKNNENVLMGYFDYNADSPCSYTSEFVQQMGAADAKLQNMEQLKNKNLTIGWVEAPYGYEGKKHGNPIAVLYRQGYKPYPITHSNDPSRIANWVAKKLTIDPVYNLKTQKEFEEFSIRFPLTFSAYLESEGQIDVYKKIAYEFNYPFFLVTNGALAKEMLGLDAPGIVASTYDFGKNRVYNKEYLTYEDYVRNWVREQVHNRVGEIKHSEDATIAFTSETDYVAILFSSKSNASHADIMAKFWSVSSTKVKSRCLTVFYADIDDTKNEELMEHLGVPHRNGIVWISHPFNIRENPITKRCVHSNTDLNKQIKLLFSADFIYNYEIDLRTAMNC